MANILSTNDILTYIKNFIKAKNPDVDTQPGTDLYDLIFWGNAQTSARIFESLQNVENLQSIFTTFGSDLDLITKNYSLTRKGATFAKGYITYYTTTWTSDIIIPTGSVVSTKSSIGTASISYKTIGDFSMLYSSKSTYFNTSTGRYEIKIPAICTVAGKIGNVSIGTVSLMQSAIQQISGITNENSFSGGVDVESDKDLQQRSALSWVVSSVATKDGFKKAMLDRAEVVDAVTVGPFDTTAVRNGVDVFCVTNSALESVKQTINYQNDTYTIITKQPIVDLNSIYNNTKSYLMTPNVSYTFNKQFTSQFTNSTVSDETVARIDWKSPWNGTVSLGGATQFQYHDIPNNITSRITNAYINTKITITTLTSPTYNQSATVTGFSFDLSTNIATFTITPLVSGSVSANDTFILDPRPNLGDSVSLNYTYNKDIATLQAYANQSNVNVIGSDILVKEGFKAKFYLILKILIFPGYDTTTVKSKVENALSQYISLLKLGPTIQLSDIIVVAQTGRGTDYVITEVDSVTIDTGVGFDGVTYNTRIEQRSGNILAFINIDSITLTAREYIVLESLTVNLI